MNLIVKRIVEYKAPEKKSNEGAHQLFNYQIKLEFKRNWCWLRKALLVHTRMDLTT